jgi:thiamine kinase-like enzyme
VEPDAIVARIWPGREAVVERLGGGITNHNFKVEVDGKRYVLRVGGHGTELLGIDRAVENAATLAAAEAGIGPGVVGFHEAEGVLITDFIEGRPVPPEEMRRPETIGLAAEALRRFHEGRAIPGRFDSFRIVEGYRGTAAAHGVCVPDAYAWAHDRAREIEAALGERPLSPCHNDLLNANFIHDGQRLRIVDWEYAGMGDVFFDLANFSINHELDAAGNAVLLKAYFGEPSGADADALELMRFMSDFREAMWGVVQQGISELDFDFAAYADEHFERLRRTAASPRFVEALASA